MMNLVLLTVCLFAAVASGAVSAAAAADLEEVGSTEVHALNLQMITLHGNKLHRMTSEITSYHIDSSASVFNSFR